ncbi:hypothetical protein EUTSA_v10000618mg [Eutrema salsugineum]|uniref:Uncharacterized protein n=1 Tax=Eutrema salsugineum TaxID=72664 RepID=V4NJE0_EUTSA|nr:hypothetical protein EUTSA_v10000618mg [Eutrema salsugineum]
MKCGTVILVITLTVFLITSSIVFMDEVLFSIGVKRKVPGGPNPIHNAHQPSIKHRHLIKVKKNSRGDSNPRHNTPHI